jgi:NDP-sugar pyrophosphorylase family protein
MSYGEITPGARIPIPLDGFVETDQIKGRRFYVPDIILVYDRKGDPYPGQFKLNQETGACIEVTADIHSSVDIGPRAIVGEGTIVRKFSSIGPSAVIEDRADIGQNVEVGRDAFVGRKSWIGNGCRLHYNSRVSPRCLLRSEVDVARFAVIPARKTVSEGSKITEDTFRYEKRR